MHIINVEIYWMDGTVHIIINYKYNNNYYYDEHS